MAESKNYFSITGVINEVSPTKSFPTPRGEFKVRTMKLEIKEKYQDKEYSTIPEFQVVNDLCNALDYGTLKVGTEVEVKFSIGGKVVKWKDKQTGEDKSIHRTELKCITIKALAVAPDMQVPQGGSAMYPQGGIPADQLAAMEAAKTGKPAYTPPPFNPLTDDESSDLPF